MLDAARVKTGARKSEHSCFAGQGGIAGRLHGAKRAGDDLLSRSLRQRHRLDTVDDYGRDLGIELAMHEGCEIYVGKGSKHSKGHVDGMIALRGRIARKERGGLGI